MTTKYQWEELPAPVRAEIERRIGKILATSSVAGGNNSQLGLRITTDAGVDMFVKGNEISRPEARFLAREAHAAEAAGHIASPGLVWNGVVAGWSLLVFEFIAGRPARFAVGSGDLGLLADALGRISKVSVVRKALPAAEERWARYITDPALRSSVGGSSLCHTDFNPENVLISNGRAVLVDWAWATIGASWIDPVIAPVWLISTAHHTPREAEAWAQRSSNWASVPRSTLAGFAEANARMWSEIAAKNVGDWSQNLHDAAARWAAHLRN